MLYLSCLTRHYIIFVNPSGDLKTFLLARRHLVGQMSQEAEVLQPARLTAMVHDIASGLDYLAKHNYVHR